MEVRELLKVKPATFGISNLTTVQGTSLLSELNKYGLVLELNGRYTIRYLAEVLTSVVDAETLDKIYSIQIDENATVEAFPIEAPRMDLDPTCDLSLRHANSIYGWTTCIVTLVLASACAWSIVMHKTYPNVWFLGISLFPLTVALFRTLGVLRNRQSMLSLILGDGATKETVLQTVVNGAASALANRGK